MTTTAAKPKTPAALRRENATLRAQVETLLAETKRVYGHYADTLLRVVILEQQVNEAAAILQGSEE